MTTLIRGGRLLDPASGRDGRFDLLLDAGVVQKVAPDLSGVIPAEGGQLDVVNAAGLTVMPGLVDIHVHLRVPGQPHKETMASGTQAAAAGGFTQICTMPNTQPVIDSAVLVEAVRDRARREGVVRVHVIGAVTKGQAGRELAPMDAMAKAGAVAFSDDGVPVADAGVMRRAMQYLKAVGVPLLDHAEEPSVSGKGVMHEGAVSLALGLPGIPAVSEALMIARDAALARETGTHLHVLHLSAALSVDAVRQAKAQGAPLTAEVTPHHLALTDAEVARLRYDPATKVNPPLRDEADRQALVAGLRDGTIDIIATDHAPHAAAEKARAYVEAPFGISASETAFALAYEALVRGADWPLSELVRRFTWEPAQVLGLAGGRLQEGDAADVALFDLDRPWMVDPGAFASKGHNTPLAGRTLSARCRATYVAGRCVYADGIAAGAADSAAGGAPHGAATAPEEARA